LGVLNTGKEQTSTLSRGSGLAEGQQAQEVAANLFRKLLIAFSDGGNLAEILSIITLHARVVFSVKCSIESP